MVWRMVGALMLAALLAGCAEISDRFTSLGSPSYAMATTEPPPQGGLPPDDGQPVGSLQAPAAIAAPVQAPPQGKYGVQIAAPRSEADARALIDTMRVKHAALLGREWASIHRVDLPNGVFYRVVVGPKATEQQAMQLCNSLKAQGSPCFIQRV